MAEAQPDGEFVGDLRAWLEVNLTERKPFRVRVSVWRWGFTNYAAEEALGWYVPRASSAYGDGFDGVRHFRDKHKAIDYLAKVRGERERLRIYEAFGATPEVGWFDAEV